MGSFRAPSARRTDIDRLSYDDRPATITDDAEWLAPGEWIEYWAVLPHTVSARIGTSSVSADIDRLGNTQNITIDPAAAILTRIRLGIVDWNINDQDGNPVPWVAADGLSLLDGLPRPVYRALQERIGTRGKAQAPDLGAADDKESRGNG